MQETIKNDILNEIEGDRWWCEKNPESKRCNFPFLYNEIKYYKPVSTGDGDNDKKCIIVDNTHNMKSGEPNKMDPDSPKDFTDGQKVALVACKPCTGITKTKQWLGNKNYM